MLEQKCRTYVQDVHTLGANTSIDLSVNSRRNADVSENPVATCVYTWSKVLLNIPMIQVPEVFQFLDMCALKRIIVCFEKSSCVLKI